MFDRFAPPPADNDNHADVPDAVSAASALAHGTPATLSLTLDADRHLRLRVACALRRCSAQAVMRDALDTYLRAIPDLERRAIEAQESGQTACLWGVEK